MRIAIFSESEADDAALHILTEAILQQSIEPVLHAGLRTRGWPSVRDVLRPVLLQLHYHTDAEGFILVVDSNSTTPHHSSHDRPNQAHAKCRLCQLRKIKDETFAHARPRQHRPPLKTAVGLAVPSIEAWLRCDADFHVNEAVWLNGILSGQPPYTTRQLKINLYGTDRPSLRLEKERMTEAASQLAQNIARLESAFPHGFAAFANDLRTWSA